MLYKVFCRAYNYCTRGDIDLEKSKPIYVADIETTGLLHNLIQQGSKAKLHNLAVMDVNTPTNGVKVFHNGDELKKFLSKPMYLIMHNGIGYDKEALEILGYDVSNVTFIDTLAISQYLYLERSKHGLENWGEEFGVPKPEIKDWEKLTQEDYDHRVTEDVKINYLLYVKMLGDLSELYHGEFDDHESFVEHRVVKYLNFKMTQLAEQAKVKIKVDIPLAESEVRKFDELIEEKTKKLMTVMPKVEVISKKTRPAKPYKKDGTLSATGMSWKELCEQAKVDFSYDGVIDVVTGYKEPNPNSSDQLKKWLYSLGWQPETFKYVKDESGERKIPQLYIPQSGGEICPSILKLAEIHPELEELTGKSIMSHRRGVVKGFLESLIADTGCVEAGANGFTNTLRLKHRKPCVNLPAVSNTFAENIRACLVSRKGKVFFGADLSGLETILKFNFQLPYDRKFVEEQMCDDFDPHLLTALSAELVTEEEVWFYKIVDKGFPREKYPESPILDEMLSKDDVWKKEEIARLSIIRHVGKQCNYACQYNAGAKTIARQTKVDLKLAKKMVEGYRKLNWSIQAIADAQRVITTSTGKWLWNPLVKMFYRIKADKDVFSTLIQGTGSYILDMWVAYSFYLRNKHKLNFSQLATFHDEKVWELLDNQEVMDKVVELSDKALEMLNNQFKLEIPIKSSWDFGYRYSEIH